MHGTGQYGAHGGGRLIDRLADFGRQLRRAGLPVDAARIALAAQAALLVGVQDRSDLRAALESVLVNREQDRHLFRRLFDAWVGAPGPGDAPPPVAGNAAASRPGAEPAARSGEDAAEDGGQRDARLEAAATASALRRLRHADFGSLTPQERHLVERLVRALPLPIPSIPARRLRRVERGDAGSRMHWPGVWREAAMTGGEILRLPRLARHARPLPLLVLVDISGSMERYARMLLAFLHVATRGSAARGGRCDVFAFGTGLTELTPAFRAADTGRMLSEAARAIEDYAGGTRVGESLGQLRTRFARRFVGRRTLVVLASDGLDTGDPGMLRSELQWLKRHSRQLLWLNPLLRFEGYAPLARGACALQQAADATLAVHNLASLERLAQGLAQLARQAS